MDASRDIEPDISKEVMKSMVKFTISLICLFLGCESNPTKTEEPLPGTNNYTPPKKTVLNPLKI